MNKSIYNINQVDIKDYQNDKGINLSPECVQDHFKEILRSNKAETILFAGADKFLLGLVDNIKEQKQSKITLLPSDYSMYPVLKSLTEYFDNVNVLQSSVYGELTVSFDCIFFISSFLNPPLERDLICNFIVKEPEGAAIENLLKYLSPAGTLYLICSPRLITSATFSSLRKHIIKDYNVDFIYTMPKSIFRPFTGLLLYFMSISRERKDLVSLGNMVLRDNKLNCVIERQMHTKDFIVCKNWVWELNVSDKYNIITKFNESVVEKVKIKDIAEIFRGKSINKDVKTGEFSVLNISNIENGEIIYDNMQTIDGEERKLKKYFLKEGDVVITCRGTKIKVAVVEKIDKKIVSSANIIMIRLKKGMLPYFLKIFLESPIGETILSSFSSRNIMMNINHSEISELMVPMPDLTKQQLLIDRYIKEQKNYKESLKKLNEDWSEHQRQIYDGMLEN